MNAPSSEPVERRGASGPSSGINSFVFFGGIIFAVGVVSAVALVMCGPENEIERRTAKSAMSAMPVDSAAVVASAELPLAVPTVIPETVVDLPAPVPAPKKKRGGRGGGGKKH